METVPLMFETCVGHLQSAVIPGKSHVSCDTWWLPKMGVPPNIIHLQMVFPWNRATITWGSPTKIHGKAFLPAAKSTEVSADRSGIMIPEMGIPLVISYHPFIDGFSSKN